MPSSSGPLAIWNRLARGSNPIVPGRNGIAGPAQWLAIVALLLPLAARGADDPLDDYRLAVGYYKKEQWKLAAEAFQSLLKKNPRHPRAESARYHFGLAVLKLDDFQQARESLRGYAKDYPDGRYSVPAAYWMGHCSLALDDYAAAEREFGQFLKAASKDDPLREWALPYLAEAELRLKKSEPAIAHFREALEAFPNGALAEDARFGLARGYESQGRVPEAIEAYEKVAADPKGLRAAEAQLNLGSLHFDAGRFAAAAAAYDSVERRFPDSPQAAMAQINRGFALYQSGEFRQALAQFDKATQNEKVAPEATLWKGLSLKALADLPGAVAVLESAYSKYREQPIAEKVLFQWADCEQRQGAYDKARRLFIEGLDRWPEGPLADEYLHAAALAAVNANNLPEAEALLARYDRDFRKRNKLRLRQEVLKGRVLTARGDLAAAEKQFQSIIDSTEIESTRQQARYYLADVLQKGRRHREVLEATDPLAALWEKAPGPAELAGVFVLRAASFLELGRAAAGETTGEAASERIERCRAAVNAATAYLQVAAEGPFAPQARSTAAIAEALAGNKPAALEALDASRKADADRPELDRTLYELGTIAYAREDWEWAAALFTELSGRPVDSPHHARALADLGWTEFKRKRFAESSAAFARLLTEHPQDELAAEAAFMRGSALQEAGELPQAQRAFADAFRREGNSEHIFLAGLQAARLLVRMKQLKEADGVYDAVLARFKQRPDADKLLDEWASAHYNADDFSRADELFRRLAADFPMSKLADNARLSVAESDLVNGRLDEARRQFQALTADSRSDETVQQRAFFQWMQIELEGKRWDELKKVCDESLRRFPAGTYRFDAQWRRAEADFHAGHFEPARDRLLKLRELRDDETVKQAAWLPQVWVLLAETQYRLKDHDAVATTVGELRSRDADSPFLYQADEVLGRSLKAQAKWPEAREAFQRVIDDPHGKQTETAAKSQFMIAETYLHEKNYEAALKESLKVEILYKYPEWQAAGLYQAGICQEALNQWKDAAKTYGELLQNYPDNADVAPKARERLELVRKKLAAR